MKQLLSLLFVFTALSFPALAGAGVAAGNLEGESGETADGAGPTTNPFSTPPPPPVGVEASRRVRCESARKS